MNPTEAIVLPTALQERFVLLLKRERRAYFLTRHVLFPVDAALIISTKSAHLDNAVLNMATVMLALIIVVPDVRLDTVNVMPLLEVP